jgi:Mrp family chromosome partitioning ATPase/uncharacterized protein involved in exopolysaccharide biosynthesis
MLDSDSKSTASVRRVPREVDEQGTGQLSARNDSLRKIHRLLRGRYKWAILLSLVLGTGGAYCGYRAGAKTYQSSGAVRVMPVVPKVLYTVDDKGLMPAFDAFVDAQVAMMKSQRVTDMVMADTAWQAVGRDQSEKAVANFNRTLDISRQSDMIWIRFADPDPQVAMTAVNAVIAAYLKRYNEVDAGMSDKRRELRESYRSTLRTEWTGLREQILAKAKQYGTDDLKAQYDFQFEERNKLETAIGEMQRAMPAAAATGSAATTRPLPELTPEEIAADGDQHMMQLLAIVDDLQRRIRVLDVNDVPEKNFERQRLTSELSVARDDVEQYAKKCLDHMDKSMLASSRAATASRMSELALAERLKSYNENLAEANVRLRKLGEDQLDIEDLRTKANSVKQELDETNRAMDELDLEAQVTGRIEVLSQADRPLLPYRDTRPTFAGAGVLGGFVGGFGLFILLGLANRRIERVDDAEPESVDTPLLGVLPRLPDELWDPQQAAIASHSVHEIRARLQIMTQGIDHQAIAITSPESGTGKTSLALALGASFAAAHFKTLLIDCDLIGGGLTRRVEKIVRRKIGQVLQREDLITEEQLQEALRLAKGSARPLGSILIELGYVSASDLEDAISMQSGDAALMGILDALAGEDLQACVAKTGIEDLFILPLGSATPNDVGSLSPMNVGRLVQSAREQFDVVLIDSGPVPGSLEAAVVASQVDLVVLTVSRGEARGLADRSYRYLVSVGACVAGLVFNRAEANDVLRYRSGSVSSSDGASSSRLSAAALKPRRLLDDKDSARFGPVATAVASYAPAPKKRTRPK